MRVVTPALRFAFLSIFACAFAACPAGKHNTGTQCTAPDGSKIDVGDATTAADGCNTCVCTAEITLDCTARPCEDAGPPVHDAGTPDDAGTADDGGVVVDAGVDEGPCVDEDGDGFYSCIDPNHPERSQLVDCDDSRFNVQPGGIELPDTPEDDNCDGHNDDYVTCPCDGSSANAADMGAAMDLCGSTVLSSSENGAAVQFGLEPSYLGVVDPRLRVRGVSTPPVVIGNSCLATMSSGDAVGTQEHVAASQCSTASDCPSTASCDFESCAFPDPDPAHADPNPEIRDLAQLHFHLKAPPNVRGFQFDFMFLSQEWPEFLCLIFNDTFYAIVNGDDAVQDGAATNAAFDGAGRPITVNVGFFEDPAQWTQSLDGTPWGAHDSFAGGCSTSSDELYQSGCQFPSYCSDPNLDVRAGSGSGWLSTSVPVEPGQEFDLTLSIHDEGDEDYDSLVVLDGFRWLANKPTLTTAKSP